MRNKFIHETIFNKFSIFFSTTVLIPLFVILTLNNISIAEFYTTTGKIVEINIKTKTLTVIYERINKTVIINFDDDTIVEVGKEKKTIADIKVGHKVEVIWNFPGKRGVARSISREPTSEEQKVIDTRKEARKRLAAEQTKIAEEKKRKAEEEKRKEINKRYNEFVEKNSIEAWPSIQELSANPFVYEGKIIAIQAHFETMQTATQGIFGVGNAPIIVSDIPKGLFKKSGLVVALAGRVLGKTELQLPLLGLMQVPHLKFVGVHFCQDNNCNDIIPEEASLKKATHDSEDRKTHSKESFNLEKKEPKFQLVSYVKDKNHQQILETTVGKRQSVPDSDYTVTIKDYIPDAELKQEPINKSDEPNNPAIFVKLFSSEKTTAEGWLIAKDRNYYEDRKQNLLIKYIWLSTERELDKALNSVETAKAQLSVSMSGQTQDYPLDLNKVFKFEGTDYTVKALQYVLNYGDRRPLGEQPPDNPAVQVEINGPEGTETRWVFEKFPDWYKMHPAKYKNVKITCSGIADTYMAKNMVRIYQTPEGKQMLVYIKDKQIAETVPWELEKKYTIPDTGNQVMVASYFPSFDFKREVIKKSDEVRAPAILAEVEGPSGKVEDWIFSSNQYATWYPDNNFALVYERTENDAKQTSEEKKIPTNESDKELTSKEALQQEREETNAIIEEAKKQQIPSLQEEGSNALKNQNWNAAVQAYKKLLEIAPENYDANTNIGTAYTMLNEFDLSIGHIIKAQQLKPAEYQPFYLMGVAYARKGDKDRAIDSLRDAIYKGYKDLSVFDLKKDTNFPEDFKQDQRFKGLLGKLEINKLISDVKDVHLFDNHSQTFPYKYDNVWDAVNYTLKDQDEKIIQSDKETGIVVTDTCRWAMNRKYYKYYILVERENDVSSKLNLKLLAHDSVWNKDLKKSFLEPMNKSHVNKKVKIFLESVKKRLE